MHSKILISLFIPASLLLCGASATELSHSQGIQQETLLIHTDRDLYIAGEYLYYQLYLVPPASTETSSRIAYMALCGPGNNFIEKVIVRVHNNIAFGSIYLPDTLSTGPYSLICFTSRMRGYHSENHISKPVFIVNRFDETLEKVISNIAEADSSVLKSHTNPSKDSESTRLIIQTNKKEYLRREKVELSIALPQGKTGSVPASISVAHKKSILFDNRESNSVRSQVHHEEGNAGNKFLPETNDVILSGNLKDDSGNGLAGERILLSTPDSLLNLQYAYTGTDGNFYFRMNPYYLGKPLYLSTDKPDFTGSIGVFDKFHLDEPINGHAAAFTQGHTDFIFRAQQYLRLQKLYETEYMLMLNEEPAPNGFRPLVYGSPKHTILPEQYTPLRDFREISRELISQVRIRRQRNGYSIRLHDERTAYQFFDEKPAIFLDAIPVSNVAEIMHLGSDHLQRIEVQNYNWAYGDMRFAGILALFSRNQEYQMLSMPPLSLVLPGFDILSPSLYIGPEYQEDDDRLNTIPDLRSLLYWRPDLRIENGKTPNLSFFTSDIKGVYVITVEGLDDNGKRFWQKTEITVN